MNRAFDYCNAWLAFRNTGLEVTSRQVSIRLPLATVLRVSTALFSCRNEGVCGRAEVDAKIHRSVHGSPGSWPGPWAAGEGVCSGGLHMFSIAVQFVTRSVVVTWAILAGLQFLSDEQVDLRVAVSVCASSGFKWSCISG